MTSMRDASESVIMSGFFEEVQRRKVYRVAAAYIIAAGFIIQIGSAVFPAWELPNWAFRLVVVLLLIGFPIALILAWAYDVTPQGIQATPKIPGTHRRRNLALLVAGGTIISIAAGPGGTKNRVLNPRTRPNSHLGRKFIANMDGKSSPPISRARWDWFCFFWQ